MEIVYDYPPLFDEISARFKITGKGIIFAWGNRIYNPRRVTIPPQLVAHESVHGRRQGSDIEGWWRRYMDEPAFRLEEELAAHAAEYDYLATHAANRQQRRGALRQTAKRLAAPLYGPMVSQRQAEALIRAAC